MAALVLAWRWLRSAEQSLGDASATARGALVWPVLLVLAGIQLSRVGVFVVDPARRTLAALPTAEEWALYHTCFTGYTEAARLAFGRDVNIYEPSHYEDATGSSRRLADARRRGLALRARRGPLGFASRGETVPTVGRETAPPREAEGRAPPPERKRARPEGGEAPAYDLTRHCPVRSCGA